MRQGSIVVNEGERSWYVILVIRSLDLFTAVNRHLKKMAPQTVWMLLSSASWMIRE